MKVRLAKWELQATSNVYELILVDDCDTDEVPGSALVGRELGGITFHCCTFQTIRSPVVAPTLADN